MPSHTVALPANQHCFFSFLDIEAFGGIGEHRLMNETESHSMPITIASLQWPFLSVTVNVLFYSHLGWILALNAIKSVFLFLI